MPDRARHTLGVDRRTIGGIVQMRRAAGIVTLIVLAATASLVLLAGPARACSCASDPDMTPEERDRLGTEAHDWVFVGRVEEVTRPDSRDGGSSGQAIPVTLSVYSATKGDVTNPMEVWTASDGAMCGYHFEVGTAYKVFAYRPGEEDGRPFVSLCGPTRLATDDEVRGGLQPPTPTTSPPTTTTPAPPPTTTTTTTTEPPTTTTTTPPEPDYEETASSRDSQGRGPGPWTYLAAGLLAGVAALTSRQARART
jgi:hypothetical protein